MRAITFYCFLCVQERVPANGVYRGKNGSPQVGVEVVYLNVANELYGAGEAREDTESAISIVVKKKCINLLN